MPAEQTEALVLRVFAWSETSLIAHLYSRDFGKLAVVAKGARRPKSPFEAALDLLSICRVVFIPKSSDALDLLTEAKLQKRFRAGTRDLLKLYLGYYVVELLDRLTDRGDRQPEIYDLAVETLASLDDARTEVRAAALRFELQLLRMSGHLPSWRACVQCGCSVPPHGEPARQADWVGFGALAGGVLCSNCLTGAKQLIRLPSSALATLDCFSQDAWRSMDLTEYPRSHRAALRGVVQRYLCVLLDRKLQMHSYLEELGR